ncbi:MAG: SUF system Fe-S cluster assembly protein [Hyphomicrobiales bacterium]|nr:SUF system Fe-S cluster assembly protein [Hyphomicrobiales bacterium]
MNKPTDPKQVTAQTSKKAPPHELPEPCAATVEAVRSGEAHPGTPKGQLTSAEIDRMTAGIVDALKSVYDPEIPVDIYDLGLIYKIDIDHDRKVEIDMTLTAPGCPVAGEMPMWVENAVGAVEGVQSVKVNMVFDPPWTMDRMTEDAKFALNLF